MSTPTGSTARPARRGPAAAAAFLGAGVLAAVLLAAGCGSAAGGAAPGTTETAGTAGATGTAETAGTAGATGTTGTAGTAGATGSGAASGGSPGGSPAPPGSARPVPTVSGGPVAAGEVACAGWPASAPTASLPVSFVPVRAERCVTGAETVPGRGLWQTATLEQADSGLSGLASALRQPPVERQPGIACPALAEIPQQVVLFNAAGQQLMPRLPSTGCGLTQSRVLLALAALHWQPVSVRLVTQVPAPAAVVSGAPRSITTVGGGSS